jgi:DtxR family Mn-dependent transcriptional regulator
MRSTINNSPAIEEYLQAIYTLSDEGATVIGARLAGFLGVSAAAVSEMLHRMQRDSLLTLDGRKEVHLTNTGAALAARVVRRHRLAERMLVDLLGYEWWKTHEEAERIEHTMSAEMEERLTRVLNDPQTCPHGNPMPGAPRRPTVSLDAVARGTTATIERIPDQFEHEPGFLEYLDSQGMRPGVTLRVIAARQGEPLVVEIDGRERSIRADCGQKVWVRA